VNDDRSTIGVRAFWKCAACASKEITHQVVLAGGIEQELAPPPGWRIEDGVTYCGGHAPWGKVKQA
jgi:hypothetical protein